MDYLTEFKICKIGTRFKQWGESELVRPNPAIFHAGEQMEGFFKGPTKGVSFDHGIEKEQVRIQSLAKD